MVIFAPVIELSKEDEIVLAIVPCINYPLCFQKDNENKMQALINSGNELNAITQAYILKLSFQVCRIDVGAQKIDSSILKTFRIV